MKTVTRTITERIGEWTTFDEEYDWYQHGVYPNNPEIVEKKIALFKEIHHLFMEGKRLSIIYDPVLSADLLIIGMYDGWPFWRPVPSVLLHHWYGNEKHTWYDIQGYKIKTEES